jgi:hypothetical protein
VAAALGSLTPDALIIAGKPSFSSNRSDSIRTALQNQPAWHFDAATQTGPRGTLTLDLQHYSRSDLERAVVAHALPVPWSRTTPASRHAAPATR